NLHQERLRQVVAVEQRRGGDAITTATDIAGTAAAENSCDIAGTAATAAVATETTSGSSSLDEDDADDDELCTPPARQPWKGVAEAWRSRTMRRLPSLAPTMSSTLRRFSIRSGAWPQWPSGAAAAAAAPADGSQACALRPPIRTFSLSELKKATRNFSKENVVGRGGHAKVYRGCLPGGELVAVKRLSAPERGGRVESFLAELGHIVSLSHPNVARLVGVGVDGGEHLVFPFSRLGCLSGRLHGAAAGEEAMPWAARFRVAVGAARGLEYLHERCARRIVHRDVKPANILLKDDYEPMICDFGLAKWLPASMTHHQVTTFEGTFGYLPPEYTSHGIFNEKTDVFAYGVVLLELLTGRRAIDAKKLSLLTWARPFLYGGGGDGDDDDDDAVRMMVDPALGGQYDAGQLAAVAYAAKICIQNSPELRPKMSEVTQILQENEEDRRSVEGSRRTFTLDRTVEMHETNGQDSATRRQLDDLRRHMALAFDFDCEHTSSAEIEQLSDHSN
ncbi:receptor-like cytosolic serine/threonine-protein kinase RBK2, partial [Oryza glaberrima]|uniref:receptor-like cytosolic serine/threonine-protein kinase RBK2 n=1 Tax=Oryza glaberrima TaxID=4538 RepID=UPI00224C55D9